MECEQWEMPLLCAIILETQEHLLYECPEVARTC